jgi:imidazolonepropionase-like amidohydrolase
MSMPHRWLSVSILLSVVLACPPPAAAQDRWQLVHAGHLLDRPERAPRGASTVLIRNDRIDAVRDGFLMHDAFDGVPADAEVIDLRRHWVLPGLIDAHVHLVSDRAGIEGAFAEFTDSPAAKAYEAAENARKTLAAGFTTVRNLGDRDGVTLALRDAIARGWQPGPRILDAGRSLSTTAGHTDPTLGVRAELHEAIPHENLCDGVESCRRAVRQQVARGVDVIKIATTAGVNSRIGAGLGRQMFEDEARTLIETAHLYGKKVAVHAHGNDGIALALAAGADSIEHGTLMEDDSIAQFKHSGAYYVPTLSTINGYKERLAANPNAYTPEVRAKIDWRISVTGKSLRRAHAAGVNIAFGTDAGVSRHGRNADEFALMVEHGMTPAEAIRAATRGGAALLGLAERIGSLEPGKQADLIAVEADPLADVGTLTQVRFVMKDGRVFVPAATR